MFVHLLYMRITHICSCVTVYDPILEEIHIVQNPAFAKASNIFKAKCRLYARNGNRCVAAAGSLNPNPYTDHRAGAQGSFRVIAGQLAAKPIQNTCIGLPVSMPLGLQQSVVFKPGVEIFPRPCCRLICPPLFCLFFYLAEHTLVKLGADNIIILFFRQRHGGC